MISNQHFSFSVQSQRRAALVQNERRKVEADAHQLHQRAAVPAGEGVRAAAVHGRLGEVPPGLGSAAHRSSGREKKSELSTEVKPEVHVYAQFLTGILLIVSRSKSGSRTDASSGANRVWSSSRPSWPNWDSLLRRRVPDLKATAMKAMRMRSSPTWTWILTCLMTPLTTADRTSPDLDTFVHTAEKGGLRLLIWIFNGCTVIYLIFYSCSFMSSLHVFSFCIFDEISINIFYDMNGDFVLFFPSHRLGDILRYKKFWNL